MKAMWGILCSFVFIITTKEISEQKSVDAKLLHYAELNPQKVAHQQDHDLDRPSLNSNHNIDYKSFGRHRPEREVTDLIKEEYHFDSQMYERENEAIRSNMDAISPNIPHRSKRQTSDNVGYTCNLYLRSDPWLWRYVKRGNQDGEPMSDELAKRTILKIFGNHVEEINDIFSQTTFNTYDNSLSYSGINFVISKTEIMTNDTEKCDQWEETAWCSRSTSIFSLLELSSRDNHDAFCLSYLFTYQQFKENGLAWAGGVCHKSTDGMSLNTGVINLHGLRSKYTQLNLIFAHEVGHSFGSPHDSDSICLPDGTDAEEGYYLMGPVPNDGTKKNHNQFSPCSRDNISRLLDDVINEKNTHRNCLTRRITTQPTRTLLLTTPHVSVEWTEGGNLHTDDDIKLTETYVGHKENRLHASYIGAITTACALTAIFLFLAVLFPYILWKRRVVFLMKLVHRFQTYKDKDAKEFDAFISYRSTEEDEHFVVHTLFPKLEKELHFKICVHFRDFMPGETIANNIIWGVENSRRTILVLTPGYIQSEFCRFEYQRAQHEMLKQKQRIIPIILQDISSARDDMDETLRTILSSITYLEWPGTADKRKLDMFWEKLALSMPKVHRNSISKIRDSRTADVEQMT